MAKFLPPKVLRRSISLGKVNGQCFLRIIRPRGQRTSVYHLVLSRLRIIPHSRLAKVGYVQRKKGQLNGFVILSLDMKRILMYLARGIHIHSTFVKLLLGE